MKTQVVSIAAVLVGIGLALPAKADNHEKPCDRSAITWNLKVKVKSRKAVEVTYKGQDVETLRVCQGDTVTWKIQGVSWRKLEIEFPDKTPVKDGKKKLGPKHTVTAKIAGPVSQDYYKYDIVVENGKKWDPRIIVEGKVRTN